MVRKVGFCTFKFLVGYRTFYTSSSNRKFWHFFQKKAKPVYFITYRYVLNRSLSFAKRLISKGATYTETITGPKNSHKPESMRIPSVFYTRLYARLYESSESGIKQLTHIVLVGSAGVLVKSVVDDQNDYNIPHFNEVEQSASKFEGQSSESKMSIQFHLMERCMKHMNENERKIAYCPKFASSAANLRSYIACIEQSIIFLESTIFEDEMVKDEYVIRLKSHLVIIKKFTPSHSSGEAAVEHFKGYSKKNIKNIEKITVKLL